MTEPRVIRVVIADDHPLVRRGWRQVLEPLDDIAVVGEAARGDEVLAVVSAERADVLLLDISMPGPNFLELLEALRQREPHLCTLVVSTHAEAMYARRAIRAGAAGYITKGESEEELVNAVRVVSRGGRYVSAALAQALAADLASGSTGARHQTLTDREHEIFLLLAAGNSVSQIARQLGVSVKTVSTHRTRILGKMVLSTNADLVRYALTHDLLG